MGDEPVSEFQQQLAALRASSTARFSPEDAERLARGREKLDLVWERIERTAVGVGDRAPGFDLPDALGRTVGLDGLLATGPAVVQFYRGGW